MSFCDAGFPQNIVNETAASAEKAEMQRIVFKLHARPVAVFAISPR